MRRTLAILALLVAACGGAAAPASPSAVAVATPSEAAPTPSPTKRPTPSPTRRATPTPEPTADPAAVRHVVEALDELAAIGAEGDVNEIADWAIAESDWFNRNPIRGGHAELVDYARAMLDLLTALSEDTDHTAATARLIALREEIATIVGGVPTPEPTGPTQFKPGDVVTVTQDGEDWAEITVSEVREVKRYEGEYADDVPAEGNVYIEALVTYKALVNGVDYNPYDWQVFAGGTAITDPGFVTEGPEPMLGSGTLPKGRNAKGWIVYEVPRRGEVLMSYGGTFANEEPVFEIVLRP